jgi:hypothetical protein
LKALQKKMADENISPQQKARAAMIARANKGKKPVKSAGVLAAEAEAKLQRANAPKKKKNFNKNQTHVGFGGGAGSFDSGHCDC